jgi:uncharacterized protein
LKSSLNPFRINIGFLINQPIGYSRALPFDFPEIKIGGEILIQNFSGTIDLIRTQDGFRAQAVFDGELENECSRCLETFREKIHSEYEEFFTFPHVDSSDDEIKVPEDGNIDFEPIIYDYVLMELPINPVCKPECKGLCMVCGQNLNQKLCEHQKEKKNKLPVSGSGSDSRHEVKRAGESLAT